MGRRGRCCCATAPSSRCPCEWPVCLLEASGQPIGRPALLPAPAGARFIASAAAQPLLPIRSASQRARRRRRCSPSPLPSRPRRVQYRDRWHLVSFPWQPEQAATAANTFCRYHGYRAAATTRPFTLPTSLMQQVGRLAGWLAGWRSCWLLLAPVPQQLRCVPRSALALPCTPARPAFLPLCFLPLPLQRIYKVNHFLLLYFLPRRRTRLWCTTR